MTKRRIKVRVRRHLKSIPTRYGKRRMVIRAHQRNIFTDREYLYR